MPKDYEILKCTHDIEVFENEAIPEMFKLLISHSGSVAPSLDGAYWLTPRQLMIIGTKLLAIGLEFAEDRDSPEIVSDLAAWCKENNLKLMGI